MQKILKLEGSILVATVLALGLMAALNFSVMSTFAQNATSANKTASGGGNATAGNSTSNTTSSSSIGPSAPPAAGPKY